MVERRYSAIIANRGTGWGQHYTPAALPLVTPVYVGRDSVVGIATRYGLDGPGIDSRWGQDFQNPS
jgi:hypothetical protein